MNRFFIIEIEDNGTRMGALEEVLSNENAELYEAELNIDEFAQEVKEEAIKKLYKDAGEEYKEDVDYELEGYGDIEHRGVNGRTIYLKEDMIIVIYQTW